MKRKIVFINQTDIDGGAARASYRLASKLFEMGQNVELHVMRKLGKDEWVFSPLGFYKKMVSRLFPRIELITKKLFGVKVNFSWSLNLFRSPLLDDLILNDSDIVHFHWVGKNMLPIASLQNFKGSVFWTLHDSWPYTGGCHITFECRRFEDVCGNCPQLLRGSRINDISNYIWEKKFNAYQGMKFHFIAPSHWIADEAKASSLLKNFPISVIPNGLDTNVYSPRGKSLMRQKMRIFNNKKIILFGAINADKDERKGMKYIIEALNILCDRDINFTKKNQVVIFGTNNQQLSNIFPLEVTCLGLIKDDNVLAEVYSAGDITVVPSTTESFGQVASESLSCGTPVVAFNTSGLKDVVDNHETGYLAECFDVYDLAFGIESLLNDSKKLEQLSEVARKRAVERFDINVTSNMMLELYESV